jgi:hypothetical protein
MLPNLNAVLQYLNSEIKMEKYSARLLSPFDCFNMKWQPLEVALEFCEFVYIGNMTIYYFLIMKKTEKIRPHSVSSISNSFDHLLVIFTGPTVFLSINCL